MEHDGNKFRNLLKDKGLTQEEFAKKINVTRHTIGRWMQEKRFSSKRWAMIDTQLSKISYISDTLIERDVTLFQMIPVVNRLAYASYTQQWDDNNYIETLQKLPAPMPKDGIYRWFEVSGDSMTCDESKSIDDGDYVLGRKLYREHWRNKFQLRKYREWIIVHREQGIMIKEISNHDTHNGDIICQSYNPTESDFTLNLDDIQELYYVKMVQKKR